MKVLGFHQGVIYHPVLVRYLKVTKFSDIIDELAHTNFSDSVNLSISVRGHAFYRFSVYYI